MGDPRHPSDEPFDAHAEAAVRERAVLADVEVPLEGLDRQPVLLDSLQQQIMVVDALPAADDLAIAAYWFANRAPALMQICQHLHGGMGVDETYDMPRYFAAVRDLARHLGGPAARAAVPIIETSGKNAELTDEERAFKDEARDYLMNFVSDADRDEMRGNRHGPAYHRIIKQMGADGWMGVGWPKEYGGCLLYTSDAADDLLRVDLGGRRIIKKKKHNT